MINGWLLLSRLFYSPPPPLILIFFSFYFSGSLDHFGMSHYRHSWQLRLVVSRSPKNNYVQVLMKVNGRFRTPVHRLAGWCLQKPVQHVINWSFLTINIGNIVLMIVLDMDKTRLCTITHARSIIVSYTALAETDRGSVASCLAHWGS